ncbi:hypothetical protein ACR6HW_10645 [Fusibacter sp. JL298sf-3]
MEYRLTRRGKVLVGVVMCALFIGMVSSGTYIVRYFGDQRAVTVESEAPPVVDATPDKVTNEEDPGGEAPVPETPEPVEVTELPETPSGHYSTLQLDDLKNFELILPFASGETHLSEEAHRELVYLMEVLKRYKDEPIAIVSYVDTASGTWTSEQIRNIGDKRIESVAQALIELGLDIERIQVQNGTQAFDDEMSDDRVAVFFSNHYGIDKNSK